MEGQKSEQLSATTSAACPVGAATSVCGGVCDGCPLAAVLRWKNPVTTGCILGAINASFFLFAVLGYSFCSLVCHAALFFMGFGLLISLLKSSPEAQRVEIVSKKQVEERMMFMYDVINDTAGEVRHVLLWHDVTKSLKVAAGLFGFAWIASWVSFPALFFIGTWILFTHAFIWDAYRTHLEPVVRPHMIQASELLSLAYQKIPRCVVAIDDRDDEEPRMIDYDFEYTENVKVTHRPPMLEFPLSP